ncbi:MAG: 5'-nucleotidase/UDP-sugar diphosphatase [Halieaceae bacterium]|jgi:5'-nucleotidase/UDP-sugar diphosphatase
MATLLFTNDFERAYDPIDTFWRDDIQRIEGIAELATLIQPIRENNPAVFLFDVGDIFTGSLARRTSGAVSLDFMQLMRYDAMSIGNHEFEYGWEVFAREKSRAPFPILGANLFYAGTEHPYALRTLMARLCVAIIRSLPWAICSPTFCAGQPMLRSV